MQNNKHIGHVFMSVNTIAIRNLELWGYHGCIAEERKVGTKFVLDFSMNFDTTNAELTDNINDTINYAAVYNVIVEEFNNPVNLIEHLGKKIIDAVVVRFPMIMSAVISVKKFNPPIEKFEGYVEFIFNYSAD